MKKNRIKAYWLLLLVLLYTAGAVLSVGEAQARYVTTATWNTVVEQQNENTVTSDCLEAVPEADDFLILLGTMPEEGDTVNFTLTAEEAASGTLEWKLTQTDYISVAMYIGEKSIDQGSVIEIPVGTTEVKMILTPTENAFTEPREAVNVSVAVTWANTLRGTFLTQLPAVEEEEEPTEETEPPTEETEPPASEPTEPVPTEPTPTEPAPTEPTPTEPTPTEPTPTEPTPTEPAPTEPGTEATGLRILEFFRKQFERSAAGLTTHNETAEDETVPEEETQPVTETEPVTPDEPDGQSEEGDDPSNPENPGEGNDGSGDSSESSEGTTEEPTEPVQEEPPAMTIRLETASNVNSAEALPIRITVPETGGAVRLGIATVVEPTDAEGESRTVLEKFPRYTRFSLTDGTSWYMLYRDDTISLELEDGETRSLLLDLSHVELDQFQVILGAGSYSAEGEIATCPTTVIPESVRYVSFSSRVLTVGTNLEIEISDYWKDYNLQYSLEMLTEDPDTKTMIYKSADLPEDCLTAEVISDETGTRIIFSIADTLPPAGTYRVSLNWTSEDTCYTQTQEIFFINYLAYTEYEKTGGAEQ